MIRVGDVQIERRGGRARQYCEFSVDGRVDRLWFEVSEGYAEYLSSDSADAFFIILALLAQERGQGIEFSSAVSTRLAYGVSAELLPALRLVLGDPPPIDVHVPTRNSLYVPEATGTALSLGVDSFHALAASLDGDYPVTHLALFNSGAFGETNDDQTSTLFRLASEAAGRAASEMNLPLLLVDSNMSELLKSPFISTHSVRNLACVFLLPGLFRRFYYASGYPVSEFRLQAGVAATHYDLLVSKALATESLEILVGGLHDRRIDKLRSIASFAPSWRHLNVCLLVSSNAFLRSDRAAVQNCSRCSKCVKTLVALDTLGLTRAT